MRDLFLQLILPVSPISTWPLIWILMIRNEYLINFTFLMGSKCIYTTIIIGQHLSFITQPNYNSVCCVLPNISPATMPFTSNRGGRAGQTCPPRPLTITFPHSTGVVLLLLMRRISHTVICPYLFYRRGVTELCKYNWFFFYFSSQWRINGSFICWIYRRQAQNGLHWIAGQRGRGSGQIIEHTAWPAMIPPGDADLLPRPGVPRTITSDSPPIP